MKNIFLRLNYQFFFGGFFAFTATVALVWLGFILGLTKSDWGTWVGSVGTVATLIGTIWIATEAARQRRRDETDFAIIAAAEFTFRLHSMQDTLRGVIERLPSIRNGAYGDIFKECCEQIQSAEIWRAEDLKPLVIIPGHLAANLAFEATRIRAIASDLVAAKNSELLTIAEVLEVERVLTLKLKIAIQELEEPSRVCAEFLAKHDFHNTPLV